MTISPSSTIGENKLRVFQIEKNNITLPYIVIYKDKFLDGLFLLIPIAPTNNLNKTTKEDRNIYFNHNIDILLERTATKIKQKTGQANQVINEYNELTITDKSIIQSLPLLTYYYLYELIYKKKILIDSQLLKEIKWIKKKNDININYANFINETLSLVSSWAFGFYITNNLSLEYLKSIHLSSYDKFCSEIAIESGWMPYPLINTKETKNIKLYRTKDNRIALLCIPKTLLIEYIMDKSFFLNKFQIEFCVDLAFIVTDLDLNKDIEQWAKENKINLIHHNELKRLNA